MVSAFFCFFGFFQHAAGGEDFDVFLRYYAFLGEVERRGGAATFGVDVKVGVGVLPGSCGKNVSVDAGVDVAFSHPDVDVVPPGFAFDVCTEELVGAEKYFLVGGDGFHYVDCVAGGAADICEGFYYGGGVNVADDDGVWVVSFPGG